MRAKQRATRKHVQCLDCITRRLCSICGEKKNVIFYKLLLRARTHASAVICSQLNKMSKAFLQKRPEFFNRKFSVIPHIIKQPQILTILSWNFILNPPYYPDFTPSCYHLLQSLQNSLNRKIFSDETTVK